MVLANTPFIASSINKKQLLLRMERLC